MKRTLRAILSADVKSYSIHMAKDDISTIEKLKAYRKIMFIHATQLNGRVVDAVGDNMLAEFESAVDAVRCAVHIQKDLKTENAKLPEDKKLEFRIGINIGDIVKDGESIYGDGVNISARIESLSMPGGICISRNVYDQVKKKLKLNYNYIGGHNLKNISDPVRVYQVLMTPNDKIDSTGSSTKKPSKFKKIMMPIAIISVILLIALGGLYRKYIYLSSPKNINSENKMAFDLPKGPSVAVLPFDNMTGDPNQEFICDGITEIIISVVSYIPELFVIARNSTFEYKGKSKNIRKIGKELNAKYVIEGSVQKHSDNLRITVQLISTETERHIWSETYDRKLEDIFKLQDEVAHNIANALQVKITDGEIAHERFDEITNVEVYNKLLKSWSYVYSLDRGNNHLAQKELNEIIDIEPNLVHPYILLAFTYFIDLWYNHCESNLICFAKMNDLINKAFELDDINSDAHFLKGNLFLMRKDLHNAAISYRQAIELNPNNSAAYSFIGYTYYALGQAQKAIDFCEKAIDLDPVASSGFYVHLGHGYYLAKDYKSAIRSFKKGLERNPRDKFPYINLARVYSTIGKDKEAKYYKSKFLEIDPNFSIKKFLKVLPYSDNKKRVNDMYSRLHKLGLPD